MNEYKTPPCNSSLATSCVESAMASSSGEGKVAAPFTEGVLNSAELELAVDEIASTVSFAPNLCVVPALSVAVQEREDFPRNFLDHLRGEEGGAIHLVCGGEAEDNDIFVDIMSGITAFGDAESEGWTFADALLRAKLSVDTLGEGVVDTSHLPTCYSSFPISSYLQE